MDFYQNYLLQIFDSSLYLNKLTFGNIRLKKNGLIKISDKYKTSFSFQKFFNIENSLFKNISQTYLLNSFEYPANLIDIDSINITINVFSTDFIQNILSNFFLTLS